MAGIQTIGVANGGGDAPGLNAVIRGVVKCAIGRFAWRVVGIRNGFESLIWPEGCVPLTRETVSGILPRGGTILGTTNRENPFGYKQLVQGKETTTDYSGLCLENARKIGLDALVVIGGDGTLRIARDFARRGLHLVGVPKTIDNDLSSTETTFGFDTALHVATEAIDRLHTTAESHHRVMFVEVMGRNAGWIALHAGIAGGADVILIPEIPFRFEAICRAVRAREEKGKTFSLIVVAEGVALPEKDPMGKPIPPVGPGNISNAIAFTLREMLQRESRVTVLGHVQRGGSPSPFDRILATRFGVAAVELIDRREFGRMVCLRAGKIASVPLEEAVEKIKFVDPQGEMVRVARSVGITFGDEA
jgi:phosphofructokinase-like protein